MVPILFKELVEVFSEHKDTFSHTLILVAYSLMWTISMTMENVRGMLIYKVEQRSARIMGMNAFKQLYKLSLKYHLDRKTGSQTNVVRRAQSNVPKIFWGTFSHLLPTTLQLVAMFTILIKYYPPFFSLILFSVFFAFMIYTTFSTKRAVKAQKKANLVDRHADGVLVDWLLNYEAVKANGMVDYAVEASEDVLIKKEKADVAAELRFDQVSLGQGIILGIGMCIMTSLIAKAVLRGDLTIGAFVLFNGYLIQFVKPLQRIESNFRHVKKALIDMKGIVEILARKPEIEDCENPIDLQGNHFEIEFKNVVFKQEDKVILNGISFKIPRESSTIIVGPTGAGKSTILRLILRLYDPDEGQILINGIDIRKISLKSLYQIVGLVPQDIVLFNDTIEANVRFARPNATKQEVEKAIERAQVSKLIRSLPKGLKTQVGERGLKLSGGEKQRIALARLFLRKNRICVFDEPTSALDIATESLVNEGIENAFPGATKVIVTHRLSKINETDNIIFLDKGRVIQNKSHSELLELFQSYKKQLEPDASSQSFVEERAPI